MNKAKNIIVGNIKNAFNYKSIYFRSAMLSWILIIFTVILFFFGIIPFQREASIKKMQSEGKDIATSIAQVTATAIISEDYSFAVEHCMKVIKGSRSILSIVITKNDGFSLIHTKDGWSTKNLDSTWYKPSEDEIKGLITKSRFGDKDVFQYSYPLKYSGINWGWIHIENSLDRFNEDFDTIYKRLIVLSIILIVLGFMWSFFFSKRLIKPINLVDSVAQSIAKGNLSVQIDVKSYTEIESLAKSFNLMAHNLKKARNELESKVKQRTKELLQSNIKLEEYKEHLEKLVEARTDEIKDVNAQLRSENKKLLNAENEITNQYNFLRTLLDVIPLPIYILDNETNFTDCNKAFSKFYREEKTNLLTKNFYSVIPDIQQADFIEKRKNLLSGDRFLTYEKQLYTSSGDLKDLIFFESTFKSAFGSSAGIVGVILDITEIKESERKTLIALAKEKELSELRTKFFSHASHEFRTPLATILSSVELVAMLNPNLSSKDNNAHLEKIYKSVDYMTNLLDDILTINKADSGKFLLNPESLNLFDFINTLIDEIQSNDKYKHLINVNCDNKDRTIFGDKKMLRLIFANLLSNAVKYSPDSTNINVTIDQSSSHIIIKIKDEGIGIPKAEQKDLFEPFFRASNTGDIKGTGLGLSLIKKIVDQHKGDISFNSEPNKGSEFIVSIPLADEYIMDDIVSA